MFHHLVSSNRLQIDAPAKVNLFLEVLNRREDGYHNINSLFQAVSLYDRLDFQLTSGPGVRIEAPSISNLPLDESNLITRAYHLMQETYNLDSGLKVMLEKNIPIAAGLAGGSADAAATIQACNTLFELDLDSIQMAELGLKIGSDLPFFFSTGQALVSGRGEILEPTDFPTNYWLVLATPPLAFSTADGYALLNLGLTNSKNAFRLGDCSNVEEFITALANSGNDFETIYLPSSPVLAQLRGVLVSCGAELARMSGSGPTMFGMFEKEPDRKSLDVLHREARHVNLVQPIPLGER